MNNWSEWIEWKGGECPVDGCTMVEVLFDDWTPETHKIRKQNIACNYSWLHDSPKGLISWYRYKLPNQPEVTTEEDEAWEEAEKRMDVVGQNGNNGEHYASKYHVKIKGIWIDVYDVLQAWKVTNPALQHLIKKALQPGERGHKTLEQDLQDIIDSAVRAKELEG